MRDSYSLFSLFSLAHSPQSVVVLLQVLSFGVTTIRLAEAAAAADQGLTCPKNDGDDCSGTGTKLDNDFNQYTDWKSASSMHQFSAKDIHGENVPLSIYKGYVCIVVNVASQCGLTDSNYVQLEQLYEKYRDSHKLKILAFPCDQFNGQEPGSSKDIANFAKTYNVQFDMFEKVKVNGPDAHPLWKWLKEKQGGFLGNAVKWNFTKFIVDKDGQPVDRFSPTTPPNDLEATLLEYF